MKNNKIKKFNEFFDDSDKYKNMHNLCVDHLTDEECDYLVSASFLNMNISDDSKYFIFMGYNPIFNKRRIKIMDTRNEKCFVILIDDFEILGEYDSNVITSEVISNLKEWITLNRKNVNRFSDSKNLEYESFEFILSLKKLL